MSRRYGRKQRREAREAIAQLEQASIDLHGMFVQQAKRRREAQDQRDFLQQLINHWDSEIRGLLGQYTSFAIDDTTFRVDHPDQIRQMPVRPPIRLPLSFDSPMEIEQASYYVETMLGFITGLEEQDQMNLRRLLTMRICIGRDQQQSAYYAFSERMWHDLKKAGPEAWQRTAARVAADLVRLIASPPKPKKPMDGDDLVDSMAVAMQSRKG